MAEAALLIAMLLGRPPGLVSTVYDMAGLSGVVVCEYESQFNERAWRRETGGTSWGLWQLYSKCHEQYRDDLLLHIVAGAVFWNECKMGTVSHLRQAGRSYESGVSVPLSIAAAYSIFNSGNPWSSLEKGREVERKYRSLCLYLWRRLR